MYILLGLSQSALFTCFLFDLTEIVYLLFDDLLLYKITTATTTITTEVAIPTVTPAIVPPLISIDPDCDSLDPIIYISLLTTIVLHTTTLESSFPTTISGYPKH